MPEFPLTFYALILVLSFIYTAKEFVSLSVLEMFKNINLSFCFFYWELYLLLVDLYLPNDVILCRKYLSFLFQLNMFFLTRKDTELKTEYWTTSTSILLPFYHLSHISSSLPAVLWR